MENGIIIELQKAALEDTADIETLLRKAFLIAKKLKLREFEEWISKEQNGYTEKVPDYRYISGDLKAWNPYRGWIPVILQGEGFDFLSKLPLSEPVSVISDAYNTCKGTSIAFTFNTQAVKFLNKNTDGFDTTYSFHTSKMELHKIISAVRDKILEWALLLEDNGIVGEGLVFSDSEKRTAETSKTINNYTNNFFSTVDNSNINQGNT